jgi:ion channel
MRLPLGLHHPSALLLLAQLLAVIVWPFLAPSRAGSAVLGVISMVAVGLALGVVRNTPALTVIAVVLGVPAVLMTIMEAVLPGAEWVVLTSALLHAPFYLYVFFGTVRYLFHDDRVTTDELYAIGAAFTVLAWAFAFIYVAVEIIWPGSIRPLSHGTGRFFDLLFFSFTNLTSVGLSDILPLGSHARSVVILEQVAGVLYVAMVISRLVAMTVRQQRP